MYENYYKIFKTGCEQSSQRVDDGDESSSNLGKDTHS